MRQLSGELGVGPTSLLCLTAPVLADADPAAASSGPSQRSTAHDSNRHAHADISRHH